MNFVIKCSNRATECRDTCPLVVLPACAAHQVREQILTAHIIGDLIHAVQVERAEFVFAMETVNISALNTTFARTDAAVARLSDWPSDCSIPDRLQLQVRRCWA